MANFDERDSTEKYHVEFDQTEQQFQLAVEQIAFTLKRHEKEYVLIDLIRLFLQIPNILLHHEGFLEDLKNRLESWDAKKTIGDWFLECVRSSE